MQFNKLALAAAVAAAPTAGVAMEPMQDSEMSSVTGQDGVSINLSNVNLTMDVGIEDTDGVATGGSTYTEPGLLLMQGQGVDTGTDSINIEMDVGDTVTTIDNSAMLEVRVDIPSVTVDTGDVYAVEGTDGSDISAGISNVTSQAGAVSAGDALLENTSITLNNLELTVQLGEEEDDFLNIASSSVVTISFGSLTDNTDNFTINDASSGESISMSEQRITNIDLTTDGITGNVEPEGLVLSVGASDLTDVNVAMMDVSMGDTSTSVATNNTGELGNVYITGLDLSGTDIAIGGH